MYFFKLQFSILSLLTALLFTTTVVFAQQPRPLSGTVKSAEGEPLAGASISIPSLNKTVMTEADGTFKIVGLSAGSNQLKISFLGYLDKLIKVTANTDKWLNIILAESEQALTGVIVAGRTKAQEVNRQAFNVTAIDGKKLYNTTLDISSALDRVAGVRVRESGGVGSNFNLSLNGFSGNHVKYFIDGIPMDNFGSSFQINNIPINIAERIEVYKGVVPMWLGSDALGGAINIVTGDRQRNYIDASYSFGSFNTHRSVINAATTTKSGFTVQLNAFQNYSDNNYKVTVEAADINTGAYAPAANLRRFHDTYHNESLIANVGLVDKSFADKLLFGITLGQNYKEIQTGARMASVFGGWHRRGNTIMPTLKYKKADLIKGLDVTINANYNLGSEQNIDTVNVRYDWYGNSKPNGTNGERSRSLFKYRNNNGLGTAMVNYKISDNQSVALSNVFTTFKREGKDLLRPDANQQQNGNKTDKNVLGLGYSYDVRDKWSATVFLKQFHQSSNVGGGGSMASTNQYGYGTAATWFLSSALQLKASYEKTNRLPDAYEIFGDVENQEGNPGLKPETSDNFNLGFSYGYALNQDNNFNLTANGIYRNATDFIYNRLNNNQSKLVADNRDGVRTWGADADLRYSHKNWLTAGATMTYQYLKNLQLYEEGFNAISPLYGDQMPNIPYLFGSGDVSVLFKNVGSKGNTLNVGYNLLFVNDFWLYWPSLGGRNETEKKKGIPRQFSHDISLVYSLRNGRYNIAFEAKNLNDARLFDNFSLQKPSRGFYLNFRYFINKTS